MKRTVLLKELAEIAGEQGVPMSVTEGGRHTKVRLGSTLLTVPRHREINELTAHSILREARREQ